MNDTPLAVVTIATVLVIAGFFLAFPRIARRGLLFGVYVGEDASEGPTARRLARRWTWAILGCTVAALVLQWAVMPRLGPVGAYVAALAALLAGYYAAYIRCHRSARALAAAAPPVAVAYLGSPAPRPLLALAALAFSLGVGLFALGYTLWSLGDLPAQMPMHFNAAGLPDDYAPRSFRSIWMVPIMTLNLGTMLSIFALLVARAKRAVRQGDEGVSLAAQERFRTLQSGMLALVAILTTGLLGIIAIGRVRVALGQADGLPPFGHIIAILLAGVALGGPALMVLRHGQGGARLEAGAGAAPLTNGLADNRRWRSGLFYVDREDPSLFVEHRFGLGYTLNFGNWKAIALLLLFLGLIVGLPLGMRILG